MPSDKISIEIDGDVGGIASVENGKSVAEATSSKLQNAVIPELDLRQANIKDVVSELNYQLRKQGVIKEGENLIDLNLGDEKQNAPDLTGLPGQEQGNESATPLITFSAKTISAKDALKIITNVANLEYKTGDDGKISLVRPDSPCGEIIHRTYDVNPSVAETIKAREGQKVGGEDVQAEQTKQYFTELGVKWPQGSSIKYLPSIGKLSVANTINNYEQFDKVLAKVADNTEKQKENEDLKGPRFKAAGVNPFFQVADKPFSTFSIDVDTASYTLARNYMNKGLLPPAESVRTEEFVNFFDYAYQPPEKGTFGVYIDCAPSKFGHGLHLLKIGVKGKRLGREEQRRAALTFLVDSSGSMDKPDRIGLIKKSIEKLMSKLNDADKVTIMQFDTSTRIVVDNQPASKRGEILKAVNNIQCANSTNLEDGMKKAYQWASRNFVPGGENRVLIMSDGVANIGDMASQVILDSVEKYRKQGIYCSVFGFGAGNYDDTMLESMANKGNGTYNFVDSEQEADRLFVEDMSATLNNIASDVKIQVEFNKDIVSRYRQLGYENRQLKKEDFRNDAIDAGEIGSGQSVTALYELGLNSGKKENICVVRVRYKRTDNGKVEEISRSIDMSDVMKSFDATDVRFRLAAGVAEFAEILRSSPHAAGSTFEDVAKQLTPVALELSLDKRIQELARLISVANGMSRADLK